MRPSVFLRVFSLKMSRRCRINHSAQLRAVLLLLAAAVVVAAGGCRQDMQNQPKFIPLRSSEFFPDHRSARDPIYGTVAWTKEPLNENTYFFTGKRGDTYGNDLPFAFNREVLERGRERYNIYCTPCHSMVGDGNGMIVQRGYKRPPSFHDQRLRNAPLGYYFDVISNGLAAMPDYASQVRTEDRWAIAAYIRALQLSQNAKPEDVPESLKEKINQPLEHQIRIPDTSAVQAPPENRMGGRQ
jgi:hypothetical protein